MSKSGRELDVSIKKLADESKDEVPTNPVADGGGAAYHGWMEARVSKLGEFAGEVRAELRSIDVRLGRMETRLDGTATKEDLQKSINALIRWMVAIGAVLGATTITVMTFVLNNAVPKANPATPQPIVIVVPAQPGATPALPTE